MLWTTPQFGFVKLSDAFSTGSSIMPQKRNPDAAELVRGKTGRIVGALVGLLTVMKGLPLAYSKDMQEDKEGVFDAFRTLALCLAAMTGMVEDMTPEPKRMKAAAGAGYAIATDLADWLVQALKIPFREAHHITGRIVALAAKRGVALERLTLDEMQSVEPRITKASLRRAGRRPLGQEPHLLRRNRAGQRAPNQARAWLRRLGSGLRRASRLGRATGAAEMATIDESALTAAKIRDMPISAALRRVLLTAAHEAGVEVVRITSGGQPGSRGQRTGSNRHDGGNAADLELVARGRTLDFTQAADLDTICRFVASAAACGATGIGAGVNYMGPRRLHVGFGNGPNDTAQVVWGEGGAAANAPGWLRDAAQLGWSYAAGAPVPEAAAPRPPGEGEAAGAGPPESPGGFANELDGLIGALLAPSARADRAVRLDGARRRRRHSALPPIAGDRRTRRGDMGDPDPVRRSLFRVAGWLIAALGVCRPREERRRFRLRTRFSTLSTGFARTLGASADPALNSAFDFLRQAVAGLRPVVADFANAPPWSAILLAAHGLIPGPRGIARRAGNWGLSVFTGSARKSSNPRDRGRSEKAGPRPTPRIPAQAHQFTPFADAGQSRRGRPLAATGGRA